MRLTKTAHPAHVRKLLMAVCAMLVGAIIFSPVRINAAYNGAIASEHIAVNYNQTTQDTGGGDGTGISTPSSATGKAYSFDQANDDFYSASVQTSAGTLSPEKPEKASLWTLIKGGLTELMNALLDALALPMHLAALFVMHLVDDVYEITITPGLGFHVDFAISEVNDLYHFFDYFLKVWAGVGFVIAAAEEGARYSSGSGNIGAFIKNVLLGAVYAGFYSSIALYLFHLSYEMGSGIMGIYSNGAYGGVNNINAAAAEGLASEVLQTMAGSWVSFSSKVLTGFNLFGVAHLLLGLFFLVVFVKMAILLLKNVAVLLALVAKGSVMGFFIMRGNMTAVTNYLMQMFGFYLQIVLQMAFYALGFKLLNVSLYCPFDSRFYLGFVFILSVNEIPGWVGGVSVEDDINKIGQEAHYLTQIMSTTGVSPSSLLNSGGASGGNSAADVANAATQESGK